MCISLLISSFMLASVTPALEPDVAILDELVKVRSVSADVKSVNCAQRLVKAWLEQRGVACVVETMPDGHEIVFASTRPGKEQDIVMATHLDTVPADDSMYPMRREGDRVFGRGVYDCKGNDVACMQALVALNGKASVGCIFGADEEIGGKTTRWMVERGYRPRKIALVVDGGWKGVIYAQKGLTYFTVTARGKGGHSAFPWNSDDNASRLLMAYARLRTAWDAAHPLTEDKWCDLLTLTQVKADGGARNRIPDTASLVVNLRSTSLDSADRTERFIRETTGLEVVRGEDSKPCQSDPNDPAVQLLKACMERRFPGEKIPLNRTMGATDARCFYDCGVPAVVTGIKGGGPHSADEWADVSSIGEAAALFVDFALALEK